MATSEIETLEWSSSSTLGSPLELLGSSLINDDLRELRNTRFLNGRTTVILVAVLTQVVVLAVVAMIMGVAVLTMCAVLGELLVIAAIATALERQMVSFSDLATFLEVSVTVLVTAITVFLAAVSSGTKFADGNITTARFV